MRTALLALGIASSGCGGPPVCEPTTGPNLLIVVADDLGIDNVGAYGLDTAPPDTPTLDGLADQGVLFRNAWSAPTCSPTRATLLTGRYGRRTGVGELVPSHNPGFVLPLDEVVLPEALCGYTSAAVGKWHLGSVAGDRGLRHPNRQGFGSYSGSWGNLYIPVERGEEEVPGDYFGFEKVVDGEVSWTETYATTDTTDDAIARVQTLEEPWLVYVAYNAPHTPFHVPPPELHALDIDDDAPDALRFDAMVQALDAELGRLLAEVDPQDTVTMFVADNGTPSAVIEAPLSETRAKGTLFEGGIRVPMIVAGAGVGVGESDALVHTADIYATALAIAQAEPLAELDGVASRHSSRIRRAPGRARRCTPSSSTPTTRASPTRTARRSGTPIGS